MVQYVEFIVIQIPTHYYKHLHIKKPNYMQCFFFLHTNSIGNLGTLVKRCEPRIRFQYAKSLDFSDIYSRWEFTIRRPNSSNFFRTFTNLLVVLGKTTENFQLDVEDHEEDVAIYGAIITHTRVYHPSLPFYFKKFCHLLFLTSIRCSPFQSPLPTKMAKNWDRNLVEIAAHSVSNYHG